MEHNLCNKKFNRLTVIKKHGHIGKKVSWECICDCGKTTYVVTNDITSGHTKSCGCYNHEVQVNHFLTHGLREHPLYNTWGKIRQRCLNPNNKDYPKYGGRGITISESWSNFENFYNDMADGYKKGLSVDRIDNEKGYSKENCKWSTFTQQANNKNNNVIVTFQGITDTVPNLARQLNLDYDTLYMRLKRGWSVEEAFTKSLRQGIRNKNRELK